MSSKCQLLILFIYLFLKSMDINPKSYKLKFLRKLIIQHNIKFWLDKRFYIQVVFPHYKRDLHPLKY